jgi:acyl carrier protein
VEALSTFERVRAIVAEELGIGENEISPDSSFVSLGADSMDMASLSIALEDELKTELPSNYARLMFTVMDVVNYVDSCGVAS